MGYNETNSWGNGYGQQPMNQVPEEVENMSVAKLVWSFLLFVPLAIPALIYFINAKSAATTNPDQAIYLAERFNYFTRLAITIGLILVGIAILYYIVVIALLANL